MRRPRHTHKCPNEKCCHIWEHDTSDIKTQTEYEAAHLCPECGTEQRYVHEYTAPWTEEHENSLKTMFDRFLGIKTTT